MAAHFVPPVIQDNPNGWGPCTTLNEFKDIPYQPFSKGDRIGKVMTNSSVHIWVSFLSLCVLKTFHPFFHFLCLF